MIKWADYLISEVRFEETATTKHISHVKVHEDKGYEITRSEIWSKNEIIKAIDNGKSFKTIVIGNNEWIAGESVFKLLIISDYYIKTHHDNTKRDNLDNLPTF